MQNACKTKRKKKSENRRKKIEKKKQVIYKNCRAENRVVYSLTFRPFLSTKIHLSSGLVNVLVQRD